MVGIDRIYCLGVLVYYVGSTVVGKCSTGLYHLKPMGIVGYSLVYK